MEEQRFYLEFEGISELFEKCACVMAFLAEKKWNPYAEDFRDEKYMKELSERLSAIDRDA